MSEIDIDFKTHCLESELKQFCKNLTENTSKGHILAIEKAIKYFIENSIWKNQLKNFSVIVEPVYLDWFDLYSNLGIVFLAWLASKTFSIFDTTPKWYHFVLPYKVDYGYKLDLEKLSKQIEIIKTHNNQEPHKYIDKRIERFYYAYLVLPDYHYKVLVSGILQEQTIKICITTQSDTVKL